MIAQVIDHLWQSTLVALAAALLALALRHHRASVRYCVWFAASMKVRSGLPQGFSEFIATFGLLAVIWGVSRRRPESVPAAVAAWITGAYWFTASTSFANPAVTLARSATNTFAGIQPADAPMFIVAQLLGAAAATALFGWLLPREGKP